MKKKMLIISCCIIAVLTISVVAVAQAIRNNEDLLEAAKKTKDQNNNPVVAIVNGEKIHSNTINFLVEAEKASQSNMGVDYYAEEISEEKILNEQIRKIVIQQEAEKKGLVASYDEAYDISLKNYNLLKDKNDENYKFLVDYMEEMGFSEKEYLKKAAESYQKTMTSANLYTDFIKDKEGTVEELRELYNAYIDSLIEKADIEYKNK